MKAHPRSDGNRPAIPALLVLLTWLLAGCTGAVTAAGPARFTPLPVDWVQRVVAGGSPVADRLGQVWTPDQGFAGGRVTHPTTPIKGTGSPGLYSSSVEGVQHYHLAVPAPGTYAIDLHFTDATCSMPGCRIFGVSVDGQPLARNLDIAAAVGRAHALTLVTETRIAGRTLDIRFTWQIGEPTISALEVAFLGSTADPTLVWHDEFTGPPSAQPNPSEWHYDVGGGGWGNQERETYTNSRANSRLDGKGHLLVVATAQGAGPDGQPSYESARLTTAGGYRFQYGVVQARLALPTGRGIWPALWMLGDDVASVGWPRSGEVDVMEANGAIPGRTWTHAIGPDSAGHAYSVGASSEVAGPTRFHVYQLTWTPVGLGFSVDGDATFGLTQADLLPHQAWVFNKPFHLLLNVAVGGTFVGSPDSSTRFPAAMTVDYVRVYR